MRSGRSTKGKAPEAPEAVDWATIAIAVPREFKQRFAEVARKRMTATSVLGRELLRRGLEALEREAA